jgi:hypothetical protein
MVICLPFKIINHYNFTTGKTIRNCTAFGSFRNCNRTPKFISFSFEEKKDSTIGINEKQVKNRFLYCYDFLMYTYTESVKKRFQENIVFRNIFQHNMKEVTLYNILI